MSKEFIDYYQILGLPPEAGLEEIRKAYRASARRLHPDARPNSATAEQDDAFRQAVEAWRVLGDPELRAAYDRARREPLPATPGFGQFLADTWRHLFGNDGPENGQDLQTRVEVELADLCSDLLLEMEVPGAIACGLCGGLGRLPAKDHDGPEQNCMRCAGLGRQAVHRHLEIKVPAGSESGLCLKFSGEGEEGLRGGQAGDLRVEIIVCPHPTLHRAGSDLFLKQAVTLEQAIFGATLEVSGLHDRHCIVLPANLAHGQTFRVKEAGLPPGPGDLIINTHIILPSGMLPEESGRLKKALAKLPLKRYPGVSYSERKA